MVPDGIGTWIRRQRVKSADKVAILFRGRETTYPQLADRIDRLASALRDRGIVEGDRVAYLGNNHPSFIEALFATTLLGGIFVPLNTRLSPAELAFQLGDCGAELLISGASLEERAAEATADLHLHRVVVTDPENGLTDLPGDAEGYDRVIELASPLGPTPRSSSTPRGRRGSRRARSSPTATSRGTASTRSSTTASSATSARCSSPRSSMSPRSTWVRCRRC